MKNSPEYQHAQNSDPIHEKPRVVVVVGCDINRLSGCFDGGNDPTTTHQLSVAHISAMADWAIGQGMFAKDAHQLAARDPIKFDEAIHEVLNMETGRLESLHNLGGWIVWYVRNKAVGERRYVNEPYRRTKTKSYY